MASLGGAGAEKRKKEGKKLWANLLRIVEKNEVGQVSNESQFQKCRAVFDGGGSGGLTPLSRKR